MLFPQDTCLAQGQNTQLMIAGACGNSIVVFYHSYLKFYWEGSERECKRITGEVTNLCAGVPHIWRTQSLKWEWSEPGNVRPRKCLNNETYLSRSTSLEISQ